MFCIFTKALSEKGAYEEADALFKKVHEIYPQNATFLVHRGINYLLLNTNNLSLYKYI